MTKILWHYEFYQTEILINQSKEKSQIGMTTIAKGFVF